jgi:signal transduction histidine kinase
VSTLLDKSEEILERWLDGVSHSLEGEDPPDQLLESYRSLARSILETGLRGSDDPPPDGELDHLIADVARESRRAGESISATLTRLQTLPGAVTSHAPSPGRGNGSEEAVAVLRAATRVGSVLDSSMTRLVRILEESEIRVRKERVGAMTAMMEILSHELDNRLGAARTAADMLDHPRIALGEEDLTRVSRLIRTSLDDAMKTVDDVQSLIQSWGEERVTGGRRSLPLPIVIRKTVAELRPTADDAGVRLEVADGQVDDPIDGARLRLILYNLVSNGIKYRDRDEEDRWVRIESERTDEGWLRLRVADNGMGIPEEDQDSIFLYRARLDDEVDGSGLGLAVAREAVEQLGGELVVSSRPGEGTTFTMTLRP